MIRMSPKSWIAVALVALIQTAVLVHIIYGRIALLRDGREIVAEVIPVDPRDIFRGDYVILGYGFSQGGNVPVPNETMQGDTVYVTLMPGEAPGQWEVASSSLSLAAPANPDHVVLKGIVNSIYNRPGQGPTASVRYGIESYFVPEGTGRELEKKVLEKKISAVLAVGTSGDVAIKALVVDGERVVEEPLL